MTLELVLWLQSGRHYGELQLPDLGYPFREHRVTVLAEPLPRVAMLQEYSPDDRPRTIELLFELTDPESAGRTYNLGRRRFHYRETTGWLSLQERYERDLHRGRRDQDARYERLMKAIDRHHALMAVGSFPVHSCALPAGWPTTITIAPTYGVHKLEGINMQSIHLSYTPKNLGLE